MKKVLTIVLAAMPSVALAHAGGHANSFAAGLGHPLGGADHVLAMLAVGLWAALTGGRALWVMPLAFVAAMLAGGLAGWAGVPLPGVEPMILASVVVIGLAAALALRVPLAVAVVGLGVFAVAHGHAHGAEGQGAALVAYGAGFALATAALHGAGLAVGLWLARWPMAVRAMGAAAAISGLGLAVAA